MTDADPLQKRKMQVIAAAFGVSLLFGASLAALNPGIFANPDATPATMEAMSGNGLGIAFQFAALLLCFAWLEMDSRQLAIRRPWWLNVGVVLANMIFVPYYLYKTRPAGLRGGAVLAYFGVLCGCMFAMMAGTLIGATLTGTSMPAPANGV
jgi:hypothetical protein